MKGFKKITSLLLVFALLLTSGLVTKFSFADEDESKGQEVSWQVVENDADRIADRLNSNVPFDDVTGMETLTGTVRVSILLDQPSTLDQGYEAASIASNRSAMNYRASLEKAQDELAAKISKNILGGEELDVVWNLTLAANIISAYVPAEKIPAIKAMKGVKDVVVENTYEPMDDVETSDEPNMAVASGMTGAQYGWGAGYTGAGSLIAIVDTGLDVDHQSFSSVAYDMAIARLKATTGKEVDQLTAEEVASVWSQLNASKRTRGTVDQTYFGSKVPYGFNYVDRNFNIIHINDTQGEHGSHVAGIAAGNRFIYEESEDGSFTLKNAISAVGTQGNAPDAQLLIMKVFGRGGGASDSDYFAAIEDAIVLGADAVNLSLGSASKGFAYNATYADLINRLTNTNIIWANSAGNSGAWADATFAGYTYSDHVNMGTGGSPATYSNTLSTASVDNDGSIGAYMLVGEDMIYYTETSGYGNAPMKTIPGTYQYVYIDSAGLQEEFDALGQEIIGGKIGIANRGTTSFFQKANGAMSNGAIAGIIVNNQPGTISMNLTGYEYSAPVVSILQTDGAILKAAAEETVEYDDGTLSFTYYIGTITVDDKLGINNYNSEYYTMSSFSSWGVPEDLSLKPEITTPGGNIYSVNGYANSDSGITGGHDQYELMSGTSMASPQTAGIVGIMSQFYRESGLKERADAYGLTQRHILQSLLMSTARPLYDKDSGNYYSVMKQGAGLADVNAAMNANVFVLMNGTTVGGEVRKDISAYAADGKVKAELGDDPHRSGFYTVEFTLNNLTDEDRFYDLEAEFFTQDVFGYYTFDSNGEPIADEEGNPVVSTYLDEWTAPLSANVRWFLDGRECIPDFFIDPNMDGEFNEEDADAILDFVLMDGTENPVEINEDDADLDGDGAVTTYDAYLALKYANMGTTVVPANGTTTVKVEFELTDIADYDDHGAFVEGYISATEKDSEDGELGVRHSIPVLGYYGSWSEPSFIDVGSVREYEYGLEQRAPYMAYPLGTAAEDITAFLGTHATLGVTYVLGGNPVLTDSQYFPERNAVNSNTALAGASYTLIRNTVGLKYQLFDESGKLINESTGGSNTYSSYYHVNQAKWMNTSTSSSYGYRPSSVKEGEEVTLALSFASEYYRNNETGEIAWDEIQPTKQLSFVIDNTAPTVSSVFGKRMTTEDSDTVILTLAATDNEYIAGVFVYDEAGNQLYGEGSRTDAKKEGARDRGDYAIVLDGANVPDHLEFEIWDYAANVTTVMVNLNKDELSDPVSVVLDTEEAMSVVGNTIKINATVYPWGTEDQRVTWTSSDETVATVEDGLVLGVGAGTATITATSVLDPNASATCEVKFITIDRDLNGIVWDENGQVWFSEFNLNTLPEYTRLTDESSIVPLTSTAYGADGTLYAVTFDTEGFLSDLYTVDEGTFEATFVGSNTEIGYMDLAPAPSLGENILMGVYGPYAVIVDATTGGYVGVFDLSAYMTGSYLVGIAYEEQYYHPLYGNTDWYFFIDDAGNLYNCGFLPYNGSYSRFGVSAVGNLGSTADVPYFQSLYYDGTDLYWSNYSESKGVVDVIFVNDLYNDGAIFKAGSFAPDVWPVGGLWNENIKSMIGIAAEGGDKAAAVIDESGELLAKAEPINFRKVSADGGLNAANVQSVVSGAGLLGIETEVNVPDKTTTATITIDAAGDVLGEDGVTYVTHNGLYEVIYDAEVLEVESCTSTLDHFRAYGVDGRVKVVFADLEGVAEGETVATIVFKTIENVDTTVYVDTIESEDNFESSEEEYEIPKVKGHLVVTASDASKEYGEEDPELEWSAEGFVGDDTEELLEGLVTVTREEGEDVGTYVITVAGPEEIDDYTIEYVEGEFEITKAHLVVTASDASKEYGEDDPELEWSAEGFVGDDTEELLEGLVTVTREEGEDVGTYEITVTGPEEIDNYTIEYVNGTFEIEQSLTVVAYPQDSFVEDEQYHVEGNILWVSYPQACKVGYLVNGEYVALPYHNLTQNSYIYLVPADVKEVIIVVKGDVNLDGSLSNADATKLKAAVKGAAELDAVQAFAADVNGDGSLSNADATKLKAVVKGAASLDW